MLVIRVNDELQIKKANEKLLEDLEFARRTEEAWQRYEAGKFKKMTFKKFLEKAKKW